MTMNMRAGPAMPANAARPVPCRRGRRAKVAAAVAAGFLTVAALGGARAQSNNLLMRPPTSKPTQCPLRYVLRNGACVLGCPVGMALSADGTTCSPCPPPNELWNEFCVARCAPGEVHTPPNGECRNPIPKPPAGTGLTLRPIPLPQLNPQPEPP